MTLYCSKCRAKVKKEKSKELKKEYPYYCPNCCENLYSFETTGRKSFPLAIELKE